MPLSHKGTKSMMSSHSNIDFQIDMSVTKGRTSISRGQSKGSKLENEFMTTSVMSKIDDEEEEVKHQT